MAVKRIVDTNFWNDDKVIELFSPEDKLFMLYLLTNPHTTQLGIYKINKKIMSFELGYSVESVSVLLDRFETKYKMIKYCTETNEIAIKNYLKYSIIKGGKPVEDCLTKELKQVKNRDLINYVFNNIKDYTNLNETVKKIINISNNEIYNDNDNDNEVSYHDTYNDTSSSKTIYDFIEENFNRLLTPIEYQKIEEWLMYYTEDIIKYAVEKSVYNNKKTFSYVNGILNNWHSIGYKTLQEIKENEEKPKQQTNNQYTERIPEWHNKEVDTNEPTKEELEEFERKLEEIKNR